MKKMFNSKKKVFIILFIFFSLIACSESKFNFINFTKNDINNIISYNIASNTAITMNNKPFPGDSESEIDMCGLGYLYNYNTQDTLFKELIKSQIDLKNFYYDMDSDFETIEKVAENNHNLNFCIYNNKKYFCIDEIYIDKLYDDSRLNSVIKEITQKYILTLIEQVHHHFQKIDVLDGYSIVINWSSKDRNAGSYSLCTPHTLCYIFSKPDIEGFTNQFISDKELINKSTVLYTSRILIDDQKARKISIY